MSRGHKVAVGTCRHQVPFPFLDNGPGHRPFSPICPSSHRTDVILFLLLLARARSPEFVRFEGLHQKQVDAPISLFRSITLLICSDSGPSCLAVLPFMAFLWSYSRKSPSSEICKAPHQLAPAQKQPHEGLRSSREPPSQRCEAFGFRLLLVSKDSIWHEKRVS